MSDSSFSPYQVDHLLLLIGENPLPNYVSACLLLKKHGTPYLIHTTDTEREATYLKEVLDDEQGTLELQPAQLQSLDKFESDAYRIQEKVGNLVQYLSAGRVGLNYTGGTKPMAVHAYRRLLSVDSKDGNPIFSYLDPRQLELCIDQENGERTRVPVRSKNLKVSLETVFHLHGKLWKTGNAPRKESIYADLAAALAQVMDDEATTTDWLDWFHRIFCSGDGHIEKAARKPSTGHSKPGNWKSKTDLAALTFPLIPMPQLVQDHIPQNLLIDIDDAQCLSMQAVKDDGKFKDLRDFCKWLEGVWLEHYALQQLRAIAKEIGLADYGMNFNVPLVGTKDGFEFDVAFTYGYQLFAISCTTESVRGLCKLKLLEAYVRAQQMGGQEARVALVCCFDDPDSLRAELAESVSDRQIRVFGRRHLPDLANAIKIWIAENDAELSQ